MSSPSSSARQAADTGPSAERGSAAFNSLVACIIVAILLSTGMAYYFRVIRTAREVALRHELASIRTAVVLFAALNRRFPASLRELVDQPYLLPNQEFSIAAGQTSFEKRTSFKRTYLEPSSIDAQGLVLDPFGKPYRYDPLRGQVTSTAGRYGNW